MCMTVFWFGNSVSHWNCFVVINWISRLVPDLNCQLEKKRPIWTGSQPYNCHTMTHMTPVGGDLETRVLLLEHLIKNDSMHVSLSLPMGQDQHDRVCVCTWYDFRGLDLHKALFGEGVSEELAHAWLQAKDGLAGGCLHQDTHKQTHTEALHTKHDSLDLLHNQNRCVKTRPLISVHTTPLDTFSLLATAQQHAFKPSRNFKSTIINVKTETKAGNRPALSKLGDYWKNLSPKPPLKLQQTEHIKTQENTP